VSEPEPIRPRIRYLEDGETVTLTDEEAGYVLATDPDIHREWSRWVAMSGQARLPMSERRGSLLIVEPEQVRQLLASRRKILDETEGGRR
jgi:hypothetical protein